MSLINQLVQKGILDQERATALEYEAKSSGKKEEELILGKGLVSESFLFGLKSEILKVPLKQAFGEEVGLKALEFIPEESARYYKMIPIGLEDDVLDVGMIYPEDLKAQEVLKFLSRQGNFSYNVFLISFSDYDRVLKRYRSFRKEVQVAIEELETEIGKEREGRESLRIEEVERLAEEAPISKVVAVLLRHATEGKASDIHIEPMGNRLRVRFRMLGILHSSILLPLSYLPALVARVKILSDLRIDETRLPQDGRFSTELDGKKIDFRVSTFPTVLGEKVAIRVLDPMVGLKLFEELGLEGKNLEILKETVQKPSGMILVNGPTGCGKTTTIYTILRGLNKEGVNIMALEDPVEYFIEGINQSQIQSEIGYTFAKGLRHILRQDPDIIMVGEIRDKETASLAINASLTGHLVLSTVHTSSAAGVIPRLVDLGVESYLIPPALNISLSQRLVRQLCEACREKILASPESRELVLKEIQSMPAHIQESAQIPSELHLWRPKGCRKCNQAGYSGRLAIFEVLQMTDNLARIIQREPSEIEINKEAFAQGMVTMRQEGVLKALRGLTTLEEVFRVTQE